MVIPYEDITKEELLDLALSYSRYVMDFADRYDTGCWPVCINEYFDCEYAEYWEDRETDMPF